jgi:hypothetical protein
MALDARIPAREDAASRSIDEGTQLKAQRRIKPGTIFGRRYG